MAPSLPFFSSKPKLDTPGPVKKLFTRQTDNFRFHLKPSITVTSPSGLSGHLGNLNNLPQPEDPIPSLFPTLTWEHSHDSEKEEVLVQKMAKIKEYLIIVEDLDGGKFYDGGKFRGSNPAVMGVFYRIPPSKTTIHASDLIKTRIAKFERLRVAERGLSGGFKYADLGGGVWRVPRAGHRIHFQVVALSGTVDKGCLSEFPSISSFYGECEGLVEGWGEWVGVFDKERGFIGGSEEGDRGDWREETESQRRLL